MRTKSVKAFIRLCAVFVCALSLLMPIRVSAASPAVFETGTSFNKAIKTLAGSTGAVNASDTNIKAFARSVSAPDSSVTTADVSSAQDKSILAWFDSDTGTIYWYSSASSAAMNTNAASMFSNLKSATSIDLTGIDTSNATTLQGMFSGCSTLTSLDLSDFDTSRVTSTNSMFAFCFNLTDLEISSFDTHADKNMSAMFYGCSSLTELDLSTFDTSAATEMIGMFQSCSSLISLDISSFDTTNTRVTSLVYSDGKLQKLSLGAHTKLTADSGLWDPAAKDPYTGKWTKTTPYNHTDIISAKDLLAKYASSPEAAVWYWEKTGYDQYAQKYESDDGVVYNDDGTKKMDDSGNMTHNLLDPNGDTVSQTESFKNPSTGDQTGYWTKISDDTWTYTFYVKNNKVDWKYWEENVPDGYTADHTVDHPGLIDSSAADKEGMVTNTKEDQPDYGSLRISKIMADSTRSFTFKVTLTDENGDALSGAKIYGETAFLDGSANVAVKAGDSVTMTDIPVGYHYHVEEINLPDNYATPTYVGADGVIAKDTTAEVTCTNTLAEQPSTPTEPTDTGTLTVTNTAKDSADTFSVYVTFSGLTPDGTYSYSGDKTFTADDHGSAEIELSMQDGSSVSFTGLPADAMYQVSEDASDAIASYQITGSDNAVILTQSAVNDAIRTSLPTDRGSMKGTDDKSASIIVAYTNVFPTYSVSITKRDDAGGFVDGAVLQIKQGDTVIHEWTTVAGEAETVSLKRGNYILHEESAPNGYDVAADISFMVTANGKIQRITADGAEDVRNLSMTDQKNMVSLLVEKTDENGNAVTGAELTLYNADGKAVKVWKTDGTKYEIDLEYGQTYTLKETGVPFGYTLADDATIVTDGDGSITVNGTAMNNGDTLTVIDKPMPFFPNTGGSGIFKSCSGVLKLIAILSALLVTMRMTKKGDHGNAE